MALKSLKHHIYLCFIVIFLSGCATVPLTQQHYVPWTKRRHVLEKLTKWTNAGVCGYQDNIINFRWQQQDRHFVVTLYAPLNLSSVKITGRGTHVKVWQNNQAKELNLNLPVTNMQYWVRGLPAPLSKYKAKFDSYGHIASLEQQNWRIQYLSYQQAGGFDLPSKMVLTRPQLRVKLVISSWQF